jgi:galactokinase/mevalonate kinase-like predicted kinase
VKATVAGPGELGPAAAAYQGDVHATTLPIGKQDQYIAAYGGIRDTRFGPGDEAAASCWSSVLWSGNVPRERAWQTCGNSW